MSKPLFSFVFLKQKMHYHKPRALFSNFTPKLHCDLT